MAGWHLRHGAADWHYFDARRGPLSACGKWDLPTSPAAVYERKPVHGILRMEPDLSRVCSQCLARRRDEGERW